MYHGCVRLCDAKVAAEYPGVTVGGVTSRYVSSEATSLYIIGVHALASRRHGQSGVSVEAVKDYLAAVAAGVDFLRSRLIPLAATADGGLVLAERDLTRVTKTLLHSPGTSAVGTAAPLRCLPPATGSAPTLSRRVVVPFLHVQAIRAFQCAALLLAQPELLNVAGRMAAALPAALTDQASGLLYASRVVDVLPGNGGSGTMGAAVRGTGVATLEALFFMDTVGAPQGM